MPLVFTLAVLLTSRRIGDRSYSAESEPLNFGSEPGSEDYLIEARSSAPNRKLQQHVFHRADLLAVRKVKRASENTWVQQLLSWFSRILFSLGCRALLDT